MLQRWADHVLHTVLNIWRSLILYVAALVLEEAISALRDPHGPDTAAMFSFACHEINAKALPYQEAQNELVDSDVTNNQSFVFCLVGFQSRKM
ncbi:hypothetical protein GIB67_009970 [Kingdonia uniflora]|uniref:WDR11 TPR domain-containing protein n=1 Tax=Kingdonia uniflora TaxID=39325 RepID=A0A7J7L909_9MAGN|nr:hypothetical protein GIB67_009970 [Kingdonia uniflora]